MRTICCAGLFRPVIEQQAPQRFPWQPGCHRSRPDRTEPASRGSPSPELVQRLWARLKEWRAVATRYENTACSFMGVLCMASSGLSIERCCGNGNSRHRGNRAERRRQLAVQAVHRAVRIGLAALAALLHGSARGRSEPILARGHAMRTDSGRPSSSMRLSTSTAMSTSVARRSSVRERSPSPITCF